MADAATPRRGGLGTIAVTTIAAGLMGYAITTIAARGLGAHDYGVFSAFWGMQYLLVGSFGGLQQEFSRAVTPAPPGRSRLGVVVRFAAAAAVVAALVTTVIVLTAGQVVFADELGAFAVPLVAGLAVYAVVAILSGVMYGISAWSVLGTVIVLDPLLRLAGILVAVIAGGGVIAAVWMSVVPYGVVVLALVFAVRRRDRREFHLDVGGRQLASNLVRTVAAGVGVSVLVSGLPLLVGLARGEAADDQVGALVFVLILTRAPLVLAVLSLQSYLVVRLKSATSRTITAISAAIVVAGCVLTLAGFLWGSPVIAAIAGEEYAVSPGLIAALVASSITTALLGATGSAVLARGRHGLYVTGWTLAAVVSAALMFLLPGLLEFRVAAALAVGPVVGLLVHLAAFVGRQTSRPESLDAA